MALRSTELKDRQQESTKTTKINMSKKPNKNKYDYKNLKEIIYPKQEGRKDQVYIMNYLYITHRIVDYLML